MSALVHLPDDVCPHCGNPVLDASKCRILRVVNGKAGTAVTYECGRCGYAFQMYWPGTAKLLRRARQLLAGEGY